MRHRLVVLMATIAATAGVGADARDSAPKPPTLKTVLSRVADYVVRFERDLSGIVAEERYTQDVEEAGTHGSQPPPATPDSHRDLRSDLLLVHAEGSNQYVQFRDVFEVDGQTVRDHDDRLLTLFIRPTDATFTQTRRIADESARYNIGNIVRNINVPVLPLRFVDPDNQWRFKFTVRSRGAGPSVTADLPDSPTFRVSTEVWVVEYRETESPTMIRTAAQRGLPTHGRFWIEPSTGRVLMSELIAEDSNVHARIDVSYQSEPLVGLSVPVEMHESYWERSNPSRVTGTATYSNFRKFDVHVNESFAPTER